MNISKEFLQKQKRQAIRNRIKNYNQMYKNGYIGVLKQFKAHLLLCPVIATTTTWCKQTTQRREQSEF